MARARKESESRTFKLRLDVLKMLDKYSEETSVPKTAVIEKALEMYLKDKVVIETEVVK